MVRGIPAAASAAATSSCRRPDDRAARTELADAEVLTQRFTLVVASKDAALLQQRHDLVDERIKAGGRDMRDEDETVAGVGLHEVVDRRRDGLR